MYVADTLSRAAVNEYALNDLDAEVDLHVNLLTSNLAVSPEKLAVIKKSVSDDQVMQLLIKYSNEGWPSD